MVTILEYRGKQVTIITSQSSNNSSFETQSREIYPKNISQITRIGKKDFILLEGGNRNCLRLLTINSFQQDGKFYTESILHKESSFDILKILAGMQNLYCLC